MYIAVVDDEKVIREDICKLIEKQRPESRVEAFSTGEELLASQGRFDIVFLDIQMDGMNGSKRQGACGKGRMRSSLYLLQGSKSMCLMLLTCMRFSIC